MRIIPLLTLAIAVLTLSWSCNRKIYTLEELPEEYLVFGSGGGFTGAVDSYFLFPNGQLIQHNSLKKDTVPLPAVKGGLAKQALKTAAAIDWSAEINEPGNLYQFIRLSGEEGEQSATWGAAGFEPPVALTELYEQLMGLLPTEEDRE